MRKKNSTASLIASALALASILMPPAASAQETRTSKERLARKANDEQRVDNCKVPVELRGATPRPGCPGEQSASREPAPSR